jgi:hypothetical protein
MMRPAPLLGLAVLLAGVLALQFTMKPLPDQSLVPAPRAAKPAARPVADTVDDDVLDSMVETLLARPPLIPSRRGSEAAAPDSDSDEDEDVPRLAGVLLGPTGGRAIFAPRKGHPLVVSEGDSVGDYTVTSIAPNTVTLNGSEGDRVIRPSHVKKPAAQPKAAKP